MRLEEVSAETVVWVSGFEWDYFVTLNFKSGTRDTAFVERVVFRFLSLLSKELFGGRSKKRVEAFATHEKHVSGNSHVHLLIMDPSRRQKGKRSLETIGDLKSQILEAWRLADNSTGTPMMGDSSEWFKTVYDVENVVGYMMKQIGFNYSPALWDAVSLSGRRSV